MEHGLIAVRLYADGRESKAVAVVWDRVFGIKDAVLAGDVYEREGVKWFTPGNGCATLTEEVRAKLIDAFKAEGVDAEDWTVGGEWLEGDSYEKNIKALADAGIKQVGAVIATKSSKDGVISSVTVLTKKAP